MLKYKSHGILHPWLLYFYALVGVITNNPKMEELILVGQKTNKGENTSFSPISLSINK